MHRAPSVGPALTWHARRLYRLCHRSRYSRSESQKEEEKPTELAHHSSRSLPSQFPIPNRPLPFSLTGRAGAPNHGVRGCGGGDFAGRRPSPSRLRLTATLRLRAPFFHPRSPPQGSLSLTLCLLYLSPDFPRSLCKLCFFHVVDSAMASIFLGA